MLWESEPDGHSPVIFLYIPAKLRVRKRRYARRVRTAQSTSKFAPYPQKRRVAFFVEYFAIFWLIVWVCIVSCVYTHFRRENRLPAVLGSEIPSRSFPYR